MVNYTSRIGKSVPIIEPEPNDTSLYIKLNDLEHIQRQALWRAITEHRPKLADIMTTCSDINKLKNNFDAAFVMERTDVEQLLKTQGLEL